MHNNVIECSFSCSAKTVKSASMKGSESSESFLEIVLFFRKDADDDGFTFSQ